jgi:hypothetical protein
VAQVIQINDRHALAFGLDWIVLDPMLSKDKQTAALRRKGANWQALCKATEEPNFGFAANLALPPRLKTLSGAGQAAIHPRIRGKTVLLLLEEPGPEGSENEVAVVGLLRGNVVIDRLVHASEVHSIRQSFFESCARADAKFKLFGRTITVDPVEEAFSWTDLLPPSRKEKRKGQTAVPISALRADLPNWVVPAVAAAAAIGVSYYWYGAHSAEKLRLKLQAKKADPMLVYAQAAKALLSQPIVPAGEALFAMRAQLRDIPTAFAGWNLTSINCDVSGACVFEWNRKLGTYQEFVERAPKKWEGISLAPEGNKISNGYQVAMPKKSLPPREKWPLEIDFIRDTVSRWQRFSDIGFKPTLKSATLAAVPPSIQPATVMASPAAIYSAEWDVRSAKWWMAEGLQSLPATVGLSSLSLHFTPTDVLFDAGGTAYVRK